MDRIIDLILRTALLFAACGTLFCLAEMFANLIASTYAYNWWTASAFFAATAVLAVARRLARPIGAISS